MVTKPECSKKFKKICDRTVSITKKEIRTAKRYSKLWTDYSTIKDSISENARRISSVNFVLQKKLQNVEALKQLQKDREDKLEQVKEEICTLEEKIKSIQSNDSEECERNKSLKLQLLRLMVLKMCTKTHINDKKIPHRVLGFTANEELSKMIPFEIDPGRLTEEAIQDALWECSYRCSGYASEWEHLFSSESDVIS